MPQWWEQNTAKWSEVAQSCPTLCDPVDCSPPGSSVHGILQARILEWVAISFSRGSSRPRDRTQVSGIAGRSLTSEPPGKPKIQLGWGQILSVLSRKHSLYSLWSKPQYLNKHFNGEIKLGRFIVRGYREPVKRISLIQPARYHRPPKHLLSTRQRAKMKTRRSCVFTRRRRRGTAGFSHCWFCRRVAICGTPDLQTYLEDQSIQQHLVPGCIFYHFAESLFCFI